MAAVAFAVGGAASARADDVLDVGFESDVKPILQRYCSECHHAGGRVVDFGSFPFRSPSTPDVDQEELVTKMLDRVRLTGRGRMPPGQRDPVPSAAVAVLQAWLDEGLAP